jgi:hypothetical protein
MTRAQIQIIRCQMPDALHRDAIRVAVVHASAPPLMGRGPWGFACLDERRVIMFYYYSTSRRTAVQAVSLESLVEAEAIP